MYLCKCRSLIIAHGENFIAIFTILSVVIWFTTSTLEIFATLVFVITMRMGICDTLDTLASVSTENNRD